MNKLVCIAGMPGAGKSTASDYFTGKGYQFVRFGQPVLDELIKNNIPVTEKSEKNVRESLRKEFGMGVMATKNIERFKLLLQNGNVIADGLYSFSEYKILKEEFGKQFVLIAVFAPPELRYERISTRKSQNDPQLRNRPFTKEEARERDFSEIENIEKGGPIAMADYTLLNIKDVNYLYKQLDEVLKKIHD